MPPEVGPFGLGNPLPQYFLLAGHVDAQHQEQGLGPHQA